MMKELIERDAAISAVTRADRACLGAEGSRENIRALPAVTVTVKPGEIERAVWSAMIWAAANNPGFNGLPEYTDGGNSFAEDEARAASARIRASLDVAPVSLAEAARVPEIAALIEAAKRVWNEACANHDKEPPTKYMAPYGGLVAVHNALRAIAGGTE